jgi:hypothetical protein
MSIAADAPGSLSSSVGAACFSNFYAELQTSGRAHWNHEPSLIQNPTGIPPQSPGLPSLRGYPAFDTPELLNPNGVAPVDHGRFRESLNIQEMRIATMNHRRHLLPLVRWDQLGRRSHLEFGYWSLFGIWSLGFGAFER